MAALTQDRATVSRAAERRRFPLAEGVMAFAGGGAVLNGDGYVEPASEAEGLTTLGVFAEQVDNTDGADGDKWVDVVAGKHGYNFDQTGTTITQADIGSLAYWVDDQTVSKTSAGRSAAGQIFDVGPEGVTLVFAPLPTTIATMGAQIALLTEVLARSTLAHFDVDLDGLVAETAVDGEAAVVTRANAIKAAYIAHIADTDAHSAADATNTVSASDATNLATSYTLLNEVKADLNAHLARADIHRRASAAPFLVSATNASDEATAEALALDISRILNLHVSSGLAL
jgi:hypothetical protein